MLRARIRRHVRIVWKVALLCSLAAALSGFGGYGQPVLPALEPQTVGRVTNLEATVAGQPPGTVRLTWTAAENAQVHFVVYIKASDAAARKFGAARMASFRGAEGVIEGLEGGTSYVFLAIGMRWNWINYGTVWGDWSSQWVFATPTGPGSTQPPGSLSSNEPTTVGPVTSVTVLGTDRPSDIRLTWSPARNAQVHFVVYIESQHRAARDFGATQMQPFVGSEGTITGLGSAKSYDFIVIGMRWNWINYGTVWGDWSPWVSAATPPFAPEPPAPPAPPTTPAPEDRAALVALYNATGGQNWSTSTNWTSDRPLGEWHGIETDANGRVSGIELTQNRLRGTIPRELAELSALTYLNLGQNELQGPIPPELGRLSRLIVLSINDNRLSGEIPSELENLRNLEFLDLSSNRLRGTIPRELAELSALTYLILGHNELQGPIPPELGRLSRLIDLSLNDNQLSGEIPSELENLRNLEFLVLWGNRLRGTIPRELAELSALTYLILGQNELQGPIPPELGRLSRLIVLGLNDNQLSGEIPSELENLRNLEFLDLSGNMLTGCVPAGLENVIVNNQPPDGLPFCSDVSGQRPDLVITRLETTGLRHSPAYDGAALIGDDFGIFTTVENRGDGPLDSAILRHYRESVEIGTENLGHFTASTRTRRGSFTVTAPAQPGIYRYRSCVDPAPGESDTTNNCSEWLQILAEDVPDLSIRRPTVSDTNPAPGDMILFSAIVSNSGSSIEFDTRMRVYHSNDPTISTSDVEVATERVPANIGDSALEIGVRLQVPTTPGTYYYGACVDAARTELDSTNNCTEGVAVTVSGGPDLVVRRSRVSDANPLPGAIITFRADVGNHGNVSSTETVLVVYRSDDRVISVRDTKIVSTKVFGYAVGVEGEESAAFRVPTAPGTYYYGACVDPVPNESDTTNNCSAAVAVTVSGSPDLVVRDVSVSNTTPDPGEEFRLYATVYNQGNGATNRRVNLNYYRSTDRRISTSDHWLDETGVSELDPGEDDDESVRLDAPSDPGTYYYGACVEQLAEESNTGNNCSTEYATVTVSGRPDLYIRPPTFDDTTPVTGSTTDVTFRLGNQGDADSGRTNVTAYRSTDRTIGPGDVSIGATNILNIEAGKGLDWVLSLKVTTNPGTYYYGACIAAVSNESDTRNNCSTATRITVVAPPDLIVPGIILRDPLHFAGTVSRVTAQVANQDKGSAGSSTTVRFYRSVDRSFNSSNQVGTRDIRPPGPSSELSSTLTFQVPTYGSDVDLTYYAACVDAVAGESNTDNNCSDWISARIWLPIALEYECEQTTNFFGAPNGTAIEGTAYARRAVRSASVRWKAIDSFGRTLADSTIQLGRMSAGESEDFEDSSNRWALFDHCEVTLNWTY